MCSGCCLLTGLRLVWEFVWISCFPFQLSQSLGYRIGSMIEAPAVKAVTLAVALSHSWLITEWIEWIGWYQQNIPWFDEVSSPICLLMLIHWWMFIPHGCIDQLPDDNLIGSPVDVCRAAWHRHGFPAPDSWWFWVQAWIRGAWTCGTSWQGNPLKIRFQLISLADVVRPCPMRHTAKRIGTLLAISDALMTGTCH